MINELPINLANRVSFEKVESEIPEPTAKLTVAAMFEIPNLVDWGLASNC